MIRLCNNNLRGEMYEFRHSRTSPHGPGLVMGFKTYLLIGGLQDFLYLANPDLLKYSKT